MPFTVSAHAIIITNMVSFSVPRSSSSYVGTHFPATIITIILSSLAFCSSSLPLLLVTLFYLLSFSFLLIDACSSVLTCRPLLADSCLTTLACRLLLADSCLSIVSCLLLATNTKLSTCYHCLACYLLQTMRQPSCLLTCDNLLLLSFF
ncbi:hypothetical protein Tco_0742443 [Tanacetum coccineum]